MYCPKLSAKIVAVLTCQRSLCRIKVAFTISIKIKSKYVAKNTLISDFPSAFWCNFIWKVYLELECSQIWLELHPFSTHAKFSHHCEPSTQGSCI